MQQPYRKTSKAVSLSGSSAGSTLNAVHVVYSQLYSQRCGGGGGHSHQPAPSISHS